MKRNIFVYSALSMALFATFSCSDETIPADWNNGNKETINFAPMLDNGGVVTRAHDGAKALNMGYTVWLENNGNSNLKKSSVATYNDTESKYSFDPALYWDDISADNASDSSTKTDVRDGATVKVWAAQFAGKETSNYSVSADHKITWTIDNNQATNGYTKNDLLVADYIATQSCEKGDDNKIKAIPLCFHHAMTKITINVIQGEGFATTPTNEISGSTTTVTLKAQNTKATIDLSKAKGDGNDAGMVTVSKESSDTKDINMKAASSAYTYTVGIETKTAAASFDAIVVEGKTLTAGESATNFAEIKIKSATNNSAYNTYNVPITAEVLTAWKLDNTNGMNLKHGVHYILNVTVKKQGIELTAVLAPWTEYTASANGAITFNPGTNEGVTGGTAAFDKPFQIYSKTTEDGANYTEGSQFYWTKTESNVGYYDYIKDQPIMYWADNNDKRYFRTALYESAATKTEITGEKANASNHTLAQATLTTNNSKVENIEAVSYDKTKDLIWGTSGETAINPTTSAVKLLFQHALAQVTIKLGTSTGEDKIELKEVKNVVITGTKIKDGELDFHAGTISIPTATSAENLEFANKDTSTDAEYKESKPYLVLPQKFAVNTTENNKLAPKIVITMNDGTTFSVSLAEIHKALKKDETDAGQASNQAWLQGENYVYTITITKEAVKFTAVVKDWETKTGSGNATMDWD